MVVAAPLSDAKGRVGVLRVALVVAALLGLLVPFAPTFPLLVALRAVQGLALAGVPAVAMAYLSEEVEPKRAGAAMGLFIAGNAVGGMVGRLVVGLLSAHLGWKGGLWGLALLDLVLAAWFARNVPPSRRFRPRPFERAAILRGLVASGRDPVLLGLYAMGFLVMGSFVTVYNYLAFSLEGPPWRLSPSVVSWVFLLYTVGVFTSPLAGRLSDRVGRPRVLMAGAAPPARGGRRDARRPAAAEAPRALRLHARLLHRPRRRLDRRRPPGRRGEGGRVGALPPRLLHGLERGRHARRARLRARRVERGRGARLGAPRAGGGRGGGARKDGAGSGAGGPPAPAG